MLDRCCRLYIGNVDFKGSNNGPRLGSYGADLSSDDASGYLDP